MRSRRVMHGEETVIMGSVFSSSNETNDRDAYVGYLDLGHDDLPPSPRPDATADPDLPWYLRFPKNRAEQAGVDAYAPIADQIRKNRQARVSREQRRLAVCMAMHIRLGQDSLMSNMEEAIVRSMVLYSEHHRKDHLTPDQRECHLPPMR